MINNYNLYYILEFYNNLNYNFCKLNKNMKLNS